MKYSQKKPFKYLNDKIVSTIQQNNWKRRPSEIRTYHRALYLTTEEGDYLRVDYNIPEKKVRLYVEIEQEGGNAYYSVIIDGRITSEKSIASGRYHGFSNKFRDRAKYFSTIPNKDILRIIGRNYDINMALSGRKKRGVQSEQKIAVRRRYFTREEENDYLKYIRKNVSHRNYLWDLFDMLLGAGIVVFAFVFWKFSFIALGITAAFYGIINGFVDMFLRERNPLFIKIVSFLILGLFAYIYGYF